MCMAEQRRVVKNTDHKNGITMSKTHTINWQKAKILEWEENYIRRILEALVIQQKRPEMKLDGSLILETHIQGEQSFILRPVYCTVNVQP